MASDQQRFPHPFQGLFLGSVGMLTLLLTAHSLVPGRPTVRPFGEIREPQNGRIPGLRRFSRMPPPAPMEARLDPAYEKDNKARRKAWNAARHRTAPDTDWKTLERENGIRKTLGRILPEPPAPPMGTWQERGSDNQAGRMHAATRSSDGSTLYAGSALGGVWRGTPDGTAWRPIGDDIYGGAHWLFSASQAEAPDRILVATAWTGLWVSDDEGERWERPTGLPEIWQIRSIEQGSDDDQLIYLLSTDYWTWSLSRSEDGGRSFSTLRSFTGGAGDLWCDRAGGSGLYLAQDGNLERSFDHGETWVTMGTIPSLAAEMRLAGSEAGAPTLWAAASGEGADGVELWRSTDAGALWERLDTPGSGGLSDYWGVFEASIRNPQLITYGGVEFHKSNDGGSTWAIQNDWGAYYGDPVGQLHADMMAFVVEVDGESERWYIGTDGGLYESRNQLETVANLSLDGLRVSQYYDVLTSSANPEHVQAGAQDQGYQVTQGVAQDDPVLGFAQIISGDYGHLSSSDGSHELVYSTYPGFTLVSIGEDEPRLATVEFPERQNRLWLPPVVADPSNPEAFFLLGNPLYRFQRGVRDNWTGEVWSETEFGSDGYETLSALAFAPSDPERVYASTSYGRMFWSEDGGRTFSLSDDSGPSSHYFYGTALVVSPTDPQTVYAGGAGYEGPAVYRSIDGGQTWDGLQEGMEQTLVYSLVISRDGEETLFAGSETGAYAWNASEQIWEDILGEEAPITIYWAAEALPHENTIRFATYGRGIWDYQMDTPGCYPVADSDGDGVDCRTDCDDADPLRHPNATETPSDGRDSDCDGEDGQNPDGTDGGEPEPNSGATEDPPDSPKGGCACSSTPNHRRPGLAIVPMLLFGALIRRRAPTRR
jgi:MYXO-CTERM domain-containing protein